MKKVLLSVLALTLLGAAEYRHVKHSQKPAVTAFGDPNCPPPPLPCPKR